MIGRDYIFECPAEWDSLHQEYIMFIVPCRTWDDVIEANTTWSIAVQMVDEAEFQRICDEYITEGV